MATFDEPSFHFVWISRREELANFRNRLKQEYAALEETSRVLRRESKCLIEESRHLRRKSKADTSKS